MEFSRPNGSPGSVVFAIPMLVLIWSNMFTNDRSVLKCSQAYDSFCTRTDVPPEHWSMVTFVMTKVFFVNYVRLRHFKLFYGCQNILSGIGIYPSWDYTIRKSVCLTSLHSTFYKYQLLLEFDEWIRSPIRALPISSVPHPTGSKNLKYAFKSYSRKRFLKICSGISENAKINDLASTIFLLFIELNYGHPSSNNQKWFFKSHQKQQSLHCWR